MKRVMLYQSISNGIKISVEAYIDTRTSDLVIEGHDIGLRVEEFWSDIDYEYVLRVPSEHKLLLLQSLKGEAVTAKDKIDRMLLQAISKKFSGNTAYSDMRAWCSSHNIVVKIFTWI